jgi:hypothetical protein
MVFLTPIHPELSIELLIIGALPKVIMFTIVFAQIVVFVPTKALIHDHTN